MYNKLSRRHGFYRARVPVFFFYDYVSDFEGTSYGLWRNVLHVTRTES